jgi:predicted phage baseplate assembly protein
VVVVADVVHAGGHTTLTFVAPGFTHRYVRAATTLCANIAPATHGESVREVLGSASGATSNATFALRKPPLTYTASSDPGGAHSSLEVRVDGVAWAEAPRLYGGAPTDEVYVVRRADDGKVAVTFGDGVQGARLPTGVENVSATYRTGIGRAGMVPAGSLTMLMTRPLGIRAVDNPLAASGAADPEERDDARRNAPNTVLTIDRVVSQQDAEDAARAFAGIGKCAATGAARRGVPWVHLTIAAAAPVADPGGAASALADHRVAATAPLRTNLIASLEAAKEPAMRIRVDTYQPAYFDVVARLLVDARYRWDDVVAAATTALVTVFGFERRSFGEPVTVTDVVAIVQATPGVVFVDLDALHRFDEPPALPPGGILVAAPVTWRDDDVTPTALAELLLVDPLGISFVPITNEGAP